MFVYINYCLTFNLSLAALYFLLYNFDKSFKGCCDMNNHFSKMFERDIDILIIQEFIDKRSFADLFLKQVGIADDEEYIITDSGERPISLGFELTFLSEF